MRQHALLTSLGHVACPRARQSATHTLALCPPKTLCGTRGLNPTLGERPRGGRYALGSSYIALPWWCGHAMFNAGTIGWQEVILTVCALSAPRIEHARRGGAAWRSFGAAWRSLAQLGAAWRSLAQLGVSHTHRLGSARVRVRALSHPLTPPCPCGRTLQILYSIAGLGIAIVNDFKSIEGDSALGMVRSAAIMRRTPPTCGRAHSPCT